MQFISKYWAPLLLVIAVAVFSFCWSGDYLMRFSYQRELKNIETEQDSDLSGMYDYLD